MELLHITKTFPPPPIPSLEKHLCGSPGAGKETRVILFSPFFIFATSCWKNRLKRKQQTFARLAGDTSSWLFTNHREWRAFKQWSPHEGRSDVSSLDSSPLSHLLWLMASDNSRDSKRFDLLDSPPGWAVTTWPTGNSLILAAPRCRTAGLTSFCPRCFYHHQRLLHRTPAHDILQVRTRHHVFGLRMLPNSGAHMSPDLSCHNIPVHLGGSHAYCHF